VSAESGLESSSPQAVAERLKAEALGFPGAWEDHPWGETVVKVGKKVFVFLGMSPAEREDGSYGFSVKLPESGEQALLLPGAEPTGYGLGRAGWVSIRVAPGDDDVPVDVFCDWIDESYRAVATKTLIKQLDAQRATEAEESDT
jgi:predicted DNA-binding protein (MmcQ/YjbR family)